MTDIIESDDNKYAYDGMAAVQFAVNGKPVEFQDMINLGLAAKLEAAVDRKREEVAGSVFGSPQQPEETPEAEVEPETDASEEPEAEELPSDEDLTNG